MWRYLAKKHLLFANLMSGLLHHLSFYLELSSVSQNFNCQRLKVTLTFSKSEIGRGTPLNSEEKNFLLVYWQPPLALKMSFHVSILFATSFLFYLPPLSLPKRVSSPLLLTAACIHSDKWLTVLLVAMVHTLFLFHVVSQKDSLFCFKKGPSFSLLLTAICIHSDSDSD